MSYEIAQQRITAVRHTNSPRLNLSGLGLTPLPPELCVQWGRVCNHNQVWRSA